MPLSHDALKSAVSAVRAGKHTPSHTAVLRNAKNFLQSNKSHPWHKSDALRGAIGKVIGEASAAEVMDTVKKKTTGKISVQNELIRRYSREHLKSVIADFRNLKGYAKQQQAIPTRGLPVSEASVDYYTPSFKRTVGEIERKGSSRGSEAPRGVVLSSTPGHKRSIIVRTKNFRSVHDTKAQVSGPYDVGGLSLKKASLWHMDLPLIKKPRSRYDHVEVGAHRHTIAHELAHTHDPSAKVPGGPWDNPVSNKPKVDIKAKKPRKKKGYLGNTPFYASQRWHADPLEVHANSVAVVPGMEATKALGLPRSQVLHDLRTGYKHASGDLYDLSDQRKNIDRNPNKVRDLTNIGLYEPVVYKGQNYRHLMNSRSAKSRTGPKLRKHSAQKLFKETNKAIEKVYGARNTTGGAVNKFGHVKLARPIGKLPEELQERVRRILGEASIDHVTPELYKDAAKVSRSLRNNTGHVRVGDSSIKTIVIPEPSNVVSRLYKKFIGSNREAFANIYGAKKPLAKRKYRQGERRGKIRASVGKFKNMGDVLTHELVHIKDPGVHVPYKDGSRKAYLKDRSEQHAYSAVTGTLGVRHLKKAGLSQDQVTNALRGGSVSNSIRDQVVNQLKSKNKPDNFANRLMTAHKHRHSLGKTAHLFAISDKYLAGEGGEGAKRKMAKELYKGIERTYGARNTTGGAVNKFGHVKLARPIGKLPEELQERVRRILGEASIDHFTPSLYRTAREFDRDIAKFKPSSFERRELKLNNEVFLSARKIKGKEGSVHVKLGGIPRIANTDTQYFGEPGVYGELDNPLRGDTIRLNAGMAHEANIPWRGELTKQGVRETPPENRIGVLAHELGHAVDPAFEWKNKNQGPRAGGKYAPAGLKTYFSGLKLPMVAGYSSQPSERFAKAQEVMFGVHMGKKAGISHQDALEVLRSGGEIERNPRHYGVMRGLKANLDKPSKVAIEATRGFNTFVGRHLSDHKKALAKFPTKQAKKGYRKLAKETHKAIERKYGPRIKGHLPEGVFEELLAGVKVRLKEEKNWRL